MKLFNVYCYDPDGAVWPVKLGTGYRTAGAACRGAARDWRDFFDCDPRVTFTVVEVEG